MGSLAAVGILFPLVMLVLIFLVLIPLPIYLGGKIAHVQHEKFTYTSCIWTGLGGGICSGILGGVINMGLVRVLTGDVYQIVSSIIALIIFVFIFGYFFRKHYLMTNSQIAIVCVSMIVFNVVIGVLLSFLAVMLGFGAIGLMSAGV